MLGSNATLIPTWVLHVGRQAGDRGVRAEQLIWAGVGLVPHKAHLGGALNLVQDEPGVNGAHGLLNAVLQLESVSQQVKSGYGQTEAKARGWAETVHNLQRDSAEQLSLEFDLLQGIASAVQPQQQATGRNPDGQQER